MKKSKILVVDDDPDFLDACAETLGAAGYEVRRVATGHEALEAVGRERPDLILLDVLLPDSQSIDICKRIKSDPILSQTFIINISGTDTSPEMQAQALEAGADGHLVKPVEPRVLQAYVRALLRIRESEEALRESEERHRLLAQELVQANSRLEEYNRLKAEFVANMSHELRTPLTAIIGFAQLVQLSAMSEPMPKVYADAFERINRNGRHLLALIDDVLDISKIEAGRMKIHREHFDLGEAVQSAFSELQSLAQQKGIQYRLSVPEELPLAFTDPLRVRQIVINLLSNAIKFTQKGSVEAELTRSSEGTARFVVRDTGVGIDEKARHIIFERFRQVDGSMTRFAGGAGLGLSIVRQLVELLGGQIEVASELGRGSTFVVTLPLVAPQNSVGPTLAPPERAFADPSVARPPEGSSAMNDEPDTKPLILIIEDDADSAALLFNTISNAGYRVCIANNGGTGLRMAQELKPAAVTLDIMMPDMDGWRVLQSMRLEPETKEIPVIVNSIVDNRPLGYRLGASDYLIKPVEPERLLTVLHGLVAKGAHEDAEGYVLVVDDEHGIREILSTALRNAGFNVRSAASGEIALKMASQVVPRVLLCDLLMPGGMSGFELIARMRADQTTAQVPIIVITSKDMTTEDRRLVSGQIADVIRKGDLLMSDLESRLRETLEELGVKPSNGKNTTG